MHRRWHSTSPPFCTPFFAASSPHSLGANLALADGDAVVLRGADDDGVPWVGTVSSHDPGKGTVAISWFYRKPDIAAPLLRKLEERHHCQLQANEVFATTHSDVNPIESVVRMCTVSSDPEDKKVRREPRAPPAAKRARHILSFLVAARPSSRRLQRPHQLQHHD